MVDFIFLGSKITADGDCSHEIKRRLLHGRKAVTNIDSILKSGDITFARKFHLVKAIVFPVVMCGCESWSVKKTEIMASGPITSWQIDGETVRDFFFLAPKPLQVITEAMKLKDTCSLEGKL